MRILADGLTPALFFEIVGNGGTHLLVVLQYADYARVDPDHMITVARLQRARRSDTAARICRSRMMTLQ